MEKVKNEKKEQKRKGGKSDFVFFQEEWNIDRELTDLEKDILKGKKVEIIYFNTKT
jgi:hypothetical protein